LPSVEIIGTWSLPRAQGVRALAGYFTPREANQVSCAKLLASTKSACSYQTIGWSQIILTLLEVFNSLACRKKDPYIANAHEY
jgi:hypothetical protein